MDPRGATCAPWAPKDRIVRPHLGKVGLVRRHGHYERESKTPKSCSPTEANTYPVPVSCGAYGRGRVEMEHNIVNPPLRQTVPPHDSLAEQAIVAIVLLTGTTSAVRHLVQPHQFFRDDCREVYQAALAIEASGRLPDAVTISGYLDDHGLLQRVGNRESLAELMNIPSARNPAEYATMIRDKFRLRQMIDITRRISAEGYTATDPAAFVADSRKQLDDLQSDGAGLTAEDLDSLAPTIDLACSLDAFEAAAKQGLIPFVSLPSWPDGPSTGHGLGAHFDRVALGGGLRAGEILGIGANSAGAGKTALAHQLADGFALRSRLVARGEFVEGPTILTPVVVLSELDALALKWRSLGRWIGCCASMFRAGLPALEKAPPDERQQAMRAWNDARRVQSEGPLAESRRWLRVVHNRLVTERSAPEFVSKLRRILELWRVALATEYPKLDVLPIVFVDPIQRYQEGDDEVRALNRLVTEIRQCADTDGFAAVVTSDTNKNSATGQNRADKRRSDVEEGVGAFRGSYTLIHEATAVVYLRRPPKAPDAELPPHSVEAVVVKNRWGHGRAPWPRFDWHAGSMRFEPLSEHATRLAWVRESQGDAGSGTGNRRVTDDMIDEHILAVVDAMPDLRNATAIADASQGKGNKQIRLAAIHRLVDEGRLVAGETGFRRSEPEGEPL